MEKTLVLMRHAKSRDQEKGQKDFDRTLMEEGIGDASIVGRFLYNKNIGADMIFSSPAIRAKETAELLAEQMKYDTHKIQYEPEIYNGSARTLLSLINGLNNDWKVVVIIGHNPAVTYLSEYLTKSVIGNIDACGYAFIKYSGEWENVSEGACYLDYYQYPSQIRQNLQ
jgi:phosphohistidine phosphatase